MLRADRVCRAVKHCGLHQPLVDFRSASSGRHRLPRNPLDRHRKRSSNLFAGDSGRRLPAQGNPSVAAHGRRADRPRHGYLACCGPAQAVRKICGHFKNAHLAACHPWHAVAPRPRGLLAAPDHRRRPAAHAAHGHAHRSPHRRRRYTLWCFRPDCFTLLSSGPTQKGIARCHAAAGGHFMSTARTTELTLSSRANAFITLTKPDVSFLVLITTAAGYYMGARGPVNWLHLLHTVFATMLIAAGTATLNHYIERDSDRFTRRTAGRPLPTGVVQPREALLFGVALSIAGAVDLYLAGGVLACALGTLTCLSYLLAYTPLKKRTVWATFVGAFPGAVPPMIGWVAASGSLDRGAWLLFAILFFWQFPHFHAIAWMYREDYARAGILMLPVVDRNGTRTFRQIVWFAAGLVAVSLLPALLGLAGVLYFFGALVVSTALVQVALWAASTKTNARAKWLMHATVLHIPVLLALMAYDKIPR